MNDMDPINETLTRWHKIVETRAASILGNILAEEVVFHCPVLHTPQVGKALTSMYLTAAVQVLANSSFQYVREVASGHHAALEFTSTIGEIQINGIDLIECDDDGQIVDFKVMLRPLKAVNLVHEMMRQMLGR